MRTLLKNEQLVLYGLVRYPQLSDTEVYRRIGMPKSTFSVLKNRLKKDGFYTTIRAPVLQHLGCTFLIVSYYQLNRKNSLEQREEVSRKEHGQYQENVYTLSESNNEVSICIAKNMTDFERNYATFIYDYEDRNMFGRKGITTIRFPFDLTRFLNYFDHAPLLYRSFTLELPDDIIDAHGRYDRALDVTRDIELNPLEKKIFLELVEDPDASDSTVAKRIGCTRQSVSKTKERLYREGHMVSKRVVDLEKLGYEILAFTHSKCNPKKSMQERMECIEYFCRTTTPILHLFKNFDRISLTPYRDFREYHKLNEEATDFCSQTDMMDGEPRTFLLSIPRMKTIVDHRYGPLLKKVLEI